MPLTLKETTGKGTTFGVWHLSESQEELLDKLVLSGEESEALAVRPGPEKKRQFLAARLLLSELTGRQDHVHYRLGGQPYLCNSNVNISISHSGPDVAAAFSDQHKVGVDIQSWPKASLLKAKEYFLNRYELAQIPSTTSVELLHIYWSAKEALFKYASGRNISLRDHLIIDPFSFSLSGRLTGRILRSQGIEEVNLIYRMSADNVLVVTDP